MIALHIALDKLPAAAKGAVVTIGNFDGVHKGHRALIGLTKVVADKIKAPLGVLTFEPHPREFFQKDAVPFRLSLLPMKTRLLNDLGVDQLYAQGFDASFAALTGIEFIETVLIRQLQVKHIVIGADFAFGKGRSGTVDTLRAYASTGAFGLSVIDAVTCPDSVAYSSTRIRELLAEGKLAAANGLLGWEWQIEGPVVHGNKKGRELGFPTANQDMHRYLRLPFGIYAVEAMIEGEAAWRPGVANLGIRPMFKIEQPLLETCLFDFDADIYGKALRVKPLKWLRPEMSFKGLEALIKQMKQDCQNAREWLSSRG